MYVLAVEVDHELGGDANRPESNAGVHVALVESEKFLILRNTRKL